MMIILCLNNVYNSIPLYKTGNISDALERLTHITRLRSLDGPCDLTELAVHIPSSIVHLEASKLAYISNERISISGYHGTPHLTRISALDIRADRDGLKFVFLALQRVDFKFKIRRNALKGRYTCGKFEQSFFLTDAS